MTIKTIIDNENAMFGIVRDLVFAVNDISGEMFAIEALGVCPRAAGESLSLTHDLHDCLAANWGAVDTLGMVVGKFFGAFDVGHELVHKEVDVTWQNQKCVLDVADRQQYAIGLNLGEISEVLEAIRLHLDRTATSLIARTDSVGECADEDDAEATGLLNNIITGQGAVLAKLLEIDSQLAEMYGLLFGVDVEKLPATGEYCGSPPEPSVIVSTLGELGIGDHAFTLLNGWVYKTCDDLFTLNGEQVKSGENTPCVFAERPSTVLFSDLADGAILQTPSTTHIWQKTVEDCPGITAVALDDTNRGWYAPSECLVVPIPQSFIDALHIHSKEAIEHGQN